MTRILELALQVGLGARLARVGLNTKFTKGHEGSERLEGGTKRGI